MFWVNVPVGIIGLVLVITGVRESRNRPPAGWTCPAPCSSAPGCVLTFVIVESEHFGWTSPITIALLVVAAALLGSFLLVESRVPEPMVPLAMFRDTRFTAACGVYAVMYLALASTFFFVTLFFQNVEGWSALEVGLSWLIMNTPFLIASTLAGRLATWIGTATCWLGVLLGGLGVLALAFLTPGAGLLAASPGYVLIGVGYGMAVPTISSVAVAALLPQHSGLASGVLNTARQVGTAVGLAALAAVGLAVSRTSWTARSARCRPLPRRATRPSSRTWAGDRAPSSAAARPRRRAARRQRLRGRPAGGAADRRRADDDRGGVRVRRASTAGGAGADRQRRPHGRRRTPERPRAA